MVRAMTAGAAQTGAGQGMTGAESGDGGNKTTERPRGDSRDARLADRLRENLKRRKALARSRADTPANRDPHAGPDARRSHDTKED